MKPVIENLLNDEYHSNRDYLSASTLKQLLANPYEYLNPIERKKDAYVVGSAFHTLTLEPHKFDSEFAVAPECDKRTKAGKETYEQFISSAEGKSVLSADEHNLVKSMSERVLNSSVAPLLQNGVAECSFFSQFGDYKVKCRPDYYIEDLGVIVDLKSTTDASPDGFAKGIANLAYHLQASLYLDVLRSLGLKAEKFVFIAVEKTEPYMMGVYELDDVALEMGRVLYNRAFELYEQREAYTEPIYKTVSTHEIVQTLSLPRWALN